MKRQISIYIGVAIIIAVALVVFIGRGNDGQRDDTSAQQATQTSETALNTYALADIATHNSAESCWTAIDGSVYDVTAWIGKHPGGSAAILSLCGKDSSAKFDKQHGGQSQPEAQLATFKIGTLAE